MIPDGRRSFHNLRIASEPKPHDLKISDIDTAFMLIHVHQGQALASATYFSR